jgi:hypothetical protein
VASKGALGLRTTTSEGAKFYYELTVHPFSIIGSN